MKLLHDYIRHLRSSPRHIQHFHALVFAGIITGAIAGYILYTDYGFWHDKYVREETVEEIVESKPEPPTKAVTRFFNEAKRQLNFIKVEGASLLEGKETYINTDFR